MSVTASTGSGTSTPYTGTSLSIPKEVIHGGVTCTVTDIEDTQLWGGTLESVTVAADNDFLSSENGVIFNKDKTVLRWYPCGKPGTSYIVPSDVTTLKDSSFRDVSALTSVTLPASLKHIRDYVFDDCKNIATLALPTSLESIGDNSLDLLKVSSMAVPEHVTTLGFYVLSRCPDLRSVELPSTLTKITWYAFSNNPVLNTVTCKATTPPVIKAGDGVFDGTPLDSATLRVPSGSKVRYQAAEGWKDFRTIEEF